MIETERDRQCLERLRLRDPAALEELYDRHGGLLYSVILRIVGRPADAEEVLQEAWLQVWRSADRYDAGRGAVVAWLLTVARSRAIDRVRSAVSRNRMEERVEADPPVSGDGPPEDVERGQVRERVRAALEVLAPQQRQVLELAYFSGLSQTEIAARLGAPLGTVKSWARQGLSKLREQLPEGLRT
jgi:RNA polymerase sigma-70 factor (ECF subfamily)